MPRTDLEGLVLSLSADFKAYEKAWAKTQGTTASNIKKMERDAAAGATRIEASMKRVGSALAGFGKGLAVGAVLAGVAGLEQLITKSIQSSAAIGDLSDKLGITSTQLQELQYGAVQANLSFDDLEGGLLKLSKNLGEAQHGAGDLLQILLSNGLSQAQVQALSFAEAMQLLADLTKNAKNEQDALLVTTAGVGKGQADKFLELFKNGSAGLADFTAKAHEAGAVLDEELIKRAQEIDDRWAALMLSLGTATQGFVLNAAGLFEGMAQSAIASFNNMADAWTFTKKVISGEPTSGTQVTPNEFGGFDITDTRTSNNPLAPLGTTAAAGKTSIANSAGVAPKPTIVEDADAIKARKDALAALTQERVKQKAAIEGVTSALEFENKQLTASDLQREINVKLREAGVTATSKEGEAIAALVTKNYELAQSQENAITKGEEFIKAQEEFQSSLMNLAAIGEDAFERIVLGGEKAEDVLKDLVKQLASAALKAALLGSGPLAGLFGTSATGGILGALIGRAGGGHVNAGQSYMIGERGREVFTPRTSGTISPSPRSGGINIQFNPVIDNRGASVEAVARMADTLSEFKRDLVSNVKTIVTQEKAKNPSFLR